MARRAAGVLSTVSLLLGASGCFADEPNASQRVHHSVIENSLTMNSLTMNSLTMNSLSETAFSTSPAVISMLDEPLSTTSVEGNSELHAALNDSDLADDDRPFGEHNLELFRYIVSCALPASATVVVRIDNQPVAVHGGLGLATDWETDRCDTACQEWTSACVGARVNVLGEQVEISLRGPHQALDTSEAERETFSFQEATFAGNIFASPGKIYVAGGYSIFVAHLFNRIAVQQASSTKTVLVPTGLATNGYVDPSGEIIPYPFAACLDSVETMLGRTFYQSCRNTDHHLFPLARGEVEQTFARVVTVNLGHVPAELVVEEGDEQIGEFGPTQEQASE